MSKKEKSRVSGIFLYTKLGTLLSSFALLCDLLDCLLDSLLHCLSFLCGHGGCELRMMTYKSTRLHIEKFFMHKRF